MPGRMHLTASLIVRNELNRYLKPCLDHLLEFCDDIRIVDDASTDGTADYLHTLGPKVKHLHWDVSQFYKHEADARNRLLEWTGKSNPTHVLAIDADEFVSDGQALRKIIERTPTLADQAWSMCMQEIWNADAEGLDVRQDGGWVEHEVVTCYRPDKLHGNVRLIPSKALASGRVPYGVRRMSRRPSCVSVLHFGWTNRPERLARYQRYVEHDGGKFHQSTHLQSIMWTDSRVRLTGMDWPAGLAAWKDLILTHAGVR